MAVWFWVSTSRNLLEPVPHLPEIFLCSWKFSLPFVTSLPLTHRVKKALCSLLPQTESAGMDNPCLRQWSSLFNPVLPCFLHPHHLSVNQQGLLLHVCGSGIRYRKSCGARFLCSRSMQPTGGPLPYQWDMLSCGGERGW